MKKPQFRSGANGTTNGKPSQTGKAAESKPEVTTPVTSEPQTQQVEKEEPETVNPPEQDTTTVTATVQEQPKQKSITDIIEKASKMNKILERRANIDAAAKQLDSFHLGSTKQGDVLTIKDSKGNSFATSNSGLIEDVVCLLKARAIAETEKAEQDARLLEAA